MDESSKTPMTLKDWNRVYAKAWADQAFKALLESDPVKALQEFATQHGLEGEIPDQIDPTFLNLSEDQLQQTVPDNTEKIYCYPPACC